MIHTDWSVERQFYALRASTNAHVEELIQRLGLDKEMGWDKQFKRRRAGEVAYEMCQHLDVKLEPSDAIKLCIACSDLAGKINESIEQEIPF